MTRTSIYICILGILGEFMKKENVTKKTKNIIKFLCSLVLVVASISFVGCKEQTKEAVDNINNHIIESRNIIFAGSDDNFYATFCVGEREEPYGLDGVVNNKVPFGIVTFAKSDNKLLEEEDYEFTIFINGEEVKGRIEKSPYDNTYSADIGRSVDDNAEISLNVEADGKSFSETLFNESKNFQISRERAIEIAGEGLKNEIAEMLKVEDNSCEAMVKILKDYSGETNRYFWYVGMVCSNGKTAGILIDVNTGEIISKKL